MGSQGDGQAWLSDDPHEIEEEVKLETTEVARHTMLRD